MAADHQAVEVAVVVDNSHALTTMLDRGELDLAVGSTPPLLGGLRYEKLGQQRVAWVGGPATDYAPVEDLDWVMTARVFVTPPPSNLDETANGWFRSVGLEPPRLSICNSVSAILGLVQAGSGVAILPVRLAAANLLSGAMRRLGLPGELPEQNISIVYDEGVLGDPVWDTVKAVRAVVATETFCEGEPALDQDRSSVGRPPRRSPPPPRARSPGPR